MIFGRQRGELGRVEQELLVPEWGSGKGRLALQCWSLHRTAEWGEAGEGGQVGVFKVGMAGCIGPAATALEWGRVRRKRAAYCLKYWSLHHMAAGLVAWGLPQPNGRPTLPWGRAASRTRTPADPPCHGASHNCTPSQI